MSAFGSASKAVAGYPDYGIPSAIVATQVQYQKYPNRVVMHQREVLLPKALRIRALGKGGFITRPAHEVIVLALIVEHPTQAKPPDGHHGRIKQSSWWAPTSPCILGFFGKRRRGSFFPATLALAALTECSLRATSHALPLGHQRVHLLWIIPYRRLRVMLGQHGFHQLIIYAVQLIAQAPRLAQRTAARPLMMPTGTFRYQQKRTVQIRHGGKSLRRFRRTFLPPDGFAHLRQRLVPGILPSNVAAPGNPPRPPHVPAVEIAPAHVALSRAQPEFADQYILHDHHFAPVSAIIHVG